MLSGHFFLCVKFIRKDQSQINIFFLIFFCRFPLAFFQFPQYFHVLSNFVVSNLWFVFFDLYDKFAWFAHVCPYYTSFFLMMFLTNFSYVWIVLLIFVVVVFLPLSNNSINKAVGFVDLCFMLLWLLLSWFAPSAAPLVTSNLTMCLPPCAVYCWDPHRDYANNSWEVLD